MEVKKFNTIGEELGGEFEEGTYREDASGRQIDIYQFDTKGKLARVLAHEFGHALGLAHLENPKAVMYRLNNGVNEKLVADDILALKKHCGIEVE
jgi:predicted Zn-dependent protease